MDRTWGVPGHHEAQQALAAQLASVTEEDLSNIKTQFLSHSPVLKMLSQMVTAEQKQ